MAKPFKFFQYTLTTLVLVLSAVFVVFFGGPSLLRNYVSSGIGTCETEPILCMSPSETVSITEANAQYKEELLPYAVRHISIRAPKGFNVVEEMTKKYYHKKFRRLDKGEMFYMLYEKPGFFPGLYPDLKKIGVRDNYEFMRRVMFADLRTLHDISDAFFVIMKGIFTPNLGGQQSARMAFFNIGRNRGFINYNIVSREHFFDCNLITPEDDFFKVYIFDPQGRLDMEKVLAIMATVKKYPPDKR